MPKTKDGGFIIDDEPVVANSPEEWGEKMRKKAGIKPSKSSHSFCDGVHVDKAGNKLVCILGEGHKGKHYSGSLDVGFEWDNEA